jgi:hypothetical protein
MLMKDAQSTRISSDDITSFAPDKAVNYATNSSWPTIRLSIGSVLLVLNYNKLEERDSDIERLDNLQKFKENR